MKKFMTDIKTLAILLITGAAFTACSSSDDDIINQPQNPTESKVYTLVVKATKDNAANSRTTRALSLDDKTLNAYWSGEETIEVGQNGVKIGTATAAPSANGETTITATLTSAPNPKDDLTFYLGGGNFNYTGQVGLLTGTNSISEKYDYAWGLLYSGNFTVSGNNVIPGGANPTIDFQKENVGQAVVKFTLLDKATNAAINVTSLTIHDSENSLLQSHDKINWGEPTRGDITISADNTNVIYAALSGVSGSNLTLTATDGTYTYTYSKSGVTFTAGEYYEITVKMIPEGAIKGLFTINAAGDKVYFSKGNLQATYNGSAWSWAFAENQWDYIGNAEGNTKVTYMSPYVEGYTGSSTTVDLFGWVGASSTWTDVNQYGITSFTTTNSYGNVAGESLKSDWGTLIGTGWRTLTKDEWVWLLGPNDAPNPGTNCRTSSTVNGVANARFAKAKLFDTTYGLIIFPDSYTHPDGVAFPVGINATDDTSWNDNAYTADGWGKMEAAGAVFLPAAGDRIGAEVYDVGSLGRYWSSSSKTSAADEAHFVNFISNKLNPQSGHVRPIGCSVRLVRPVE